MKISRTILLGVTFVLLGCAIEKPYLETNEVDTYVQEANANIAKAYVKINGQIIQPKAIEFTENEILLIGDDGFLVLGFDAINAEPTGEAVYVVGDIFDDKQALEQHYVLANQQLAIQPLGDDYLIQGLLTHQKSGDVVSFAVRINEYYVIQGDSTLTVAGDKAYLNGSLGVKAYNQIKQLTTTNPVVKTLVLQNVPGSSDDRINAHTGRLIRQAGLNTYLQSESVIASGGTDLFLAGVKRSIEPGAKVGVHSWCCYDGDIEAVELDRTHDAHQGLINYSVEMLGDKGRDFYFFTINAATANEIHWMSEQELVHYALINH